MKNFGNRQIIGKCSICGGIVSVPKVYMSVNPPVPKCESCGAVENVTENLPVIPMRPVSDLKKHSWKRKEYRGGLYCHYEGTIIDSKHLDFWG